MKAAFKSVAVFLACALLLFAFAACGKDKSVTESVTADEAVRLFETAYRSLAEKMKGESVGYLFDFKGYNGVQEGSKPPEELTLGLAQKGKTGENAASQGTLKVPGELLIELFPALEQFAPALKGEVEIPVYIEGNYLYFSVGDSYQNVKYKIDLSELLTAASGAEALLPLLTRIAGKLNFSAFMKFEKTTEKGVVTLTGQSGAEDFTSFFYALCDAADDALIQVREALDDLDSAENADCKALVILLAAQLQITEQEAIDLLSASAEQPGSIAYLRAHIATAKTAAADAVVREFSLKVVCVINGETLQSVKLDGEFDIDYPSQNSAQLLTSETGDFSLSFETADKVTLSPPSDLNSYHEIKLSDFQK